jgi:putative flippase GtrA
MRRDGPEPAPLTGRASSSCGICWVLTLAKASGVGYAGRMQEEATAIPIRTSGTPVSQDRSRETLASGGTFASGEHPPFGEHPHFAQRPHMRLLHGMRRPANWLQLVRFGLVGGTGFVVNLVVYALCSQALGIDYRAASVAAWLVAVLNNFLLNRHWTFDAAAGSVRFQAVRFFTVSLVAEVFSLALLTALVEGGGVAKVPAQAVAVAVSMPLNFLGNKLWSFRAST